MVHCHGLNDGVRVPSNVAALSFLRDAILDQELFPVFTNGVFVLTRSIYPLETPGHRLLRVSNKMVQGELHYTEAKLFGRNPLLEQSEHFLKMAWKLQGGKTPVAIANHISLGKLVATGYGKDAAVMAGSMQTIANAILALPQYTFGYYTRDTGFMPVRAVSDPLRNLASRYDKSELKDAIEARYGRYSFGIWRVSVELGRHGRRQHFEGCVDTGFQMAQIGVAGVETVRHAEPGRVP